MNISTIPHIGAISPEYLVDKIVIVIDTFRATSTIVTALANGIKKIIPVTCAEEAIQMVAPHQLLAGEHLGLQIEGFPLGNSPRSFLDEQLKGKEVVFSTTNGTKALIQSQLANTIWIGSLLNAKAVARKLVNTCSTKIPIILFCAGTRGDFSWEDSVTAGAIISHLVELSNPTSIQEWDLDDLSNLCLTSFQALAPDQLSTLFHSRSGQRNLSLKNKKDLLHCIQLNLYDLVPVYQHGYITL